MEKTKNLQDTFLCRARAERVPLTLFLMNGFQLRGTLKAFDSFTVVLDSEGKQQLAIAVGCTGGQHRSVAIAEATADYLRSHGYRVSIAHRDLSLAERADGSLVANNKAYEGGEGK